MLLRSSAASGYAIWTDPEAPTQERDTLTCVHCDLTWHVRPGSGNTRGWCQNCAGPTCGHRSCQACVPFMKKIEAFERQLMESLSRDAFYRAVGI